MKLKLEVELGTMPRRGEGEDEDDFLYRLSDWEVEAVKKIYAALMSASWNAGFEPTILANLLKHRIEEEIEEAGGERMKFPDDC